jgi:hypothetical protein
MGYSATELRCIHDKICLRCQRAPVTVYLRCKKCRQLIAERDRQRAEAIAQREGRTRRAASCYGHSYSVKKQEAQKLEQEATVRSHEQILETVRALPLAQRMRVIRMVQRHVRACRRIGIYPESIPRVWIEACEEVQATGIRADVEEPQTAYESPWKYQQYVSPIAEGY